MNKIEAAKLLLQRRQCRDNLFEYVKYINGHLPWIEGEHHKIICSALEKAERGELTRIIIESPPRHSKSEIVSRAFPAWSLGRNPKRQMICASYAEELAIAHAGHVRDVVASDQYQVVFPGNRLHPDAKAKALWRTSEGGVYRSVGVGGGITGFGGDIIVLDDLYKGRPEAESETVRSQTWAWFIGTLWQRKQPGAVIIIMQTRWHEDDIASRARDIDDWHIISLPAISKDEQGKEKALWPEYWPLKDLQKEREVYLKANRVRDWDSQYQQNPTPESGSYISREWFDDEYSIESLPSHLNIYVASDFAVTEKKAGNDPDFTVHGVFGQGPDGTLYVLDWWRGREAPNVWIDKLLDLIAKWKPLCWFGEKGQIVNSIYPYLKRRINERRIYFREELLASRHKKDERGRSFQGAASQGVIRFPRDKLWAREVIDNCVKFPGGAHDDDFDVMSLICLALDKQVAPGVQSTQKPRKPDYNANWGNYSKSGSSWKTK